jgi:serine/threonine-protein kinase
MAIRTSRYELLLRLASGGMATVHVGRVRGPLGFSRLVAIKRAHPHLAEDAAFVRMLVDEAKLASRIHHPNVVAVLDIEQIRLVMDYVEGAALSELGVLAAERDVALAPGIAVRMVLDACVGLQAAHDLTDEDGAHLGLVHRDISPHNLLVGVDGLTRVSDFGIAKPTTQPNASTTTGSLKGKLAYMAPEYIESGKLDVRSDVFAMGVVLWETLARAKLFRGDNDLETMMRVAKAEAPTLSSVAPWVGETFDELLKVALAKNPDERFSSARAFAAALESEAKAGGMLATHAEVGAVVKELCKTMLDERRAKVKARAEQLDALSLSAGSSGNLRAAVDAALESIDAPVPAEPATLDGSGISSRSAKSLDSLRSEADARRSRRRWIATLVVATVLGGAAAIVATALSSTRGPATSPAAQPSAQPLAASVETSRVVPGAELPSATVTPSAPSASSSSAPVLRPSALPTTPLLPTGRAAPGDPYHTVAPNPYGGH